MKFPFISDLFSPTVLELESVEAVTPVAVQVRKVNKTLAVVQEIHDSYDNASEELLKEAKLILSKPAILNDKNKIDRMHALGFTGYSGRFVYTYEDPEFEYQQCHEARRSLDDMILIANTYFDNISDKDVLQSLLDSKECYLVFFCTDICKPVFIRLTESEAFQFASRYDSDYSSVNNIRFYKGNLEFFSKSDYSLGQIETMFNSLALELV